MNQSRPACALSFRALPDNDEVLIMTRPHPQARRLSELHAARWRLLPAGQATFDVPGTLWIHARAARALTGLNDEVNARTLGRALIASCEELHLEFALADPTPPPALGSSGMRAHHRYLCMRHDMHLQDVLNRGVNDGIT